MVDAPQQQDYFIPTTVLYAPQTKTYVESVYSPLLILTIFFYEKMDSAESVFIHLHIKLLQIHDIIIRYKIKRRISSNSTLSFLSCIIQQFKPQIQKKHSFTTYTPL